MYRGSFKDTFNSLRLRIEAFNNDVRCVSYLPILVPYQGVITREDSTVENQVVWEDPLLVYRTSHLEGL